MDNRINCNNCPLLHVELDTLCETYCSDMADYREEIRAEVIEKFAEKIRAYSGEHYIDCDGYGCSTDLVFMTDAFLDDIVEQLKENK